MHIKRTLAFFFSVSLSSYYFSNFHLWLFSSIFRVPGRTLVKVRLDSFSPFLLLLLPSPLPPPPPPPPYILILVLHILSFSSITPLSLSLSFSIPLFHPPPSPGFYQSLSLSLFPPCGRMMALATEPRYAFLQQNGLTRDARKTTMPQKRVKWCTRPRCASGQVLRANALA